eukprot:ctg_378.g139
MSDVLLFVAGAALWTRTSALHRVRHDAPLRRDSGRRAVVSMEAALTRREVLLRGLSVLLASSLAAAGSPSTLDGNKLMARAAPSPSPEALEYTPLPALQGKDYGKTQGYPSGRRVRHTRARRPGGDQLERLHHRLLRSHLRGQEPGARRGVCRRCGLLAVRARAGATDSGTGGDAAHDAPWRCATDHCAARAGVPAGRIRRRTRPRRAQAAHLQRHALAEFRAGEPRLHRQDAAVQCGVGAGGQEGPARL